MNDTNSKSKSKGSLSLVIASFTIYIAGSGLDSHFFPRRRHRDWKMRKQADNLVANLGGTTGRANVRDHLWKGNLKPRSLVRVTVNVKVIKLPSHTWSILIVLMIMDSRTQSYYKPIITDYSLITRSLWLSDKPDRIGSNAENEKSCWTINMLIHHCFSSF